MDSKQQENAEAGSTYGVSTVIERLARHLALACPDEADDGAEGLPAWHGQVEHAAPILALMKEPDEAMAREGDGDIWRRLVDAPLRPRSGEGRLGEECVRTCRNLWTEYDSKLQARCDTRT